MPAGVLHTIIFNRALGAFRPKEVDSELFDITYVSSKLSSAYCTHAAVPGRLHMLLLHLLNAIEGNACIFRHSVGIQK